MADEKNVALNLVVRGEKGFQSVKELKQYLKDLNTAMLQMGDTSSREFAQLARAAAEARDQIDGINDNIRAFDPDNKFAGLAQGAQGIANGIQLATSAMALFGSESEDVQKIMMRVQAAMAFSQAIAQIGEMKGAFEAFNTAVRANPILGVVAAIIALTTAAVALYQAFKNNSEEIKNANKELEKQQKINEKLIPEYERQAKLAEAQGESMEDVNDIRRKGIDLQLLEAHAAANLALAKIKQVQENDSLYESYLRVNREVAKSLGQSEQVAIYDALIAQNKRERSDEALKEFETQVNTIKDLRNELKILDANENQEAKKKAEEWEAKQKALREKEEAERRKWAAERVKAEQALNDEVSKLQEERFMSQSESELDRIAREEEIAIADFKRRNKGLEDEEAYYEGLRRLQEKYGRMKQVETDRMNQEELDAEWKRMEEELAAYSEHNAKLLADEISTQQAIKAAKVSLRQSAFDILNSIADLEIDNEKKQKKIKKHIALADLAIDTAKAIGSMTREAADAAAKAQAITPVPGAGALFYVGYYAARLATIMKNVSQARRLLSTETGESLQVESSGAGGAGVSTPNATTFTPVVPPTTTLTSGLNTTSQQQTNQTSTTGTAPTMRAYVLERDITNTQSNVSIYEQSATFTG